MPYYYRATGEAYKEIDGYQLSARTFPNQWSFPNQLSVVYFDIGQYEQGLQEGLEAARVQPGIEQPYVVNWMPIYVWGSSPRRRNWQKC